MIFRVVDLKRYRRLNMAEPLIAFEGDGEGSEGERGSQWEPKVMYQSNRSFNIPPPGHLNFGKFFLFKFPPPQAEKLFKCPHPHENYQITVLTMISEGSIILLKLCMCKRGLLDNTLTCYQILGIFHINTLSQTSSMNSPLLYFTSNGQDDF